MTTAQNRAGDSLKHLRTSHNISQPLVAAIAGTSTAYLAKVENGVITPTNSYMRKVTEAIVRLMGAPPKPCPVLGCDNTKHVDRVEDGGGSASWHHADSREGDGWSVAVEWFGGQDTDWVVYALVDAEGAFTPGDFLAFSTAYREASALAAILNGRGAVI